MAGLARDRDAMPTIACKDSLAVVQTAGRVGGRDDDAARTPDRPYREAMSHEEAQSIVRDGGGSQWDPTIVTLFLDMLTARPDLKIEEDVVGRGGLILPDHAHHPAPKIIG